VSQSIVEQLFRRNEATALAAISRALALLGETPESVNLRLILHENRIGGLFFLGRDAEGGRALGEALALGEGSGSPARLAALRVRAGEFYFYSGQWDDAIAELDVAAELRIDPSQATRARAIRSLIAIHRDEVRGVHASVSEDSRSDSSMDADGRNLGNGLAIARAVAAEHDGEPECALQLFLDIADPASTGAFPDLSPDRYVWLPDIVRRALVAGRTNVAEAAVDACLAEVGRHPLPLSHASALHCRASSSRMRCCC
jgi:hypothetical protein